MYVFLAAIALTVLHHLCLWLERRGWLFYRDRKPSGSAMGGAFMEIDAFLRPGVRHEIEARKEIVHQDEAGDPPEPDVTSRSN